MPLEDGIFTFGNGVRLRLKKPSAVAVEGVQSRLHKDDPEPQPPMIENKDKFRDEPNINDPAYKAEWIAWTSRTGMKVTDILLLTGTERDSENEDLVKGVYGPESDEVAQWLDALGLGLPEDASVHQRYIAWLKYYVAKEDEFTEVATELVKLGGISEEHIREAEETFRNRAFGAADTQSPTD